MITESLPKRYGDPEQRPQGETGASRPKTATDRISDIVLTLRTPGWWWLGFAVSLALLLSLVYLITMIFTRGVGIWGINVPVVWGIAIINLVFWIGIGHAGTLISAILLLMRQEWRGSLSRFAEAMTLFALACAGLFPILHLGRPWLAIWLLPYPDSVQLNPQWRSPLVWDAFAISTYLLVSLLFWFMGMIPDLGMMRDRAKNRAVKYFYGALALGWRGDAVHWERYHTATFLLAALATPLVISVHSVVSLDFAVSLLPGWHHTIFPPYFVAGAVFSGLAMVLLVAIPLRSALKLQNIITLGHIDAAGKVMLVTGLIVVYGYAMEIFAPIYTGNPSEWALTISRFTGTYAGAFWALLIINAGLSQLLWFKAVRTNMGMMMFISLFVMVGMWLERFIIIVTSLNINLQSSMWREFIPRGFDYLTIIAPFGLFFTLLFLFIRLLPMIPMAETEEMLHEKGLSSVDAEVATSGD